MFLGHLHLQLAGSCSNGLLHLIGGHLQLQILGFNVQGGKHQIGLHLGLHSQLNSSVMHNSLIPMGIHKISP